MGNTNIKYIFKWQNIIKSLLFIQELILISCNNSNSKLAYALELSGSNRSELERVISHYKKNQTDRLKLKAAEFLIENMPGHYTLKGETIDHYREMIDEDSLTSYYYKKLLDIVLDHFVQNHNNVKKEEDIQHIKADFLIRHIDASFELFDKYALSNFIPFDFFLEYILPYRFSNERLDLWRDSMQVYSDSPTTKFLNYNQTSLQTNLYLHESKKISNTLIQHLFGNNPFTDCYSISYQNILDYHSLGLPAMIDFIPFYSNRNGYHYWKANPPLLYKESYIQGAFDRRTAKVFRVTFSRNITVIPKNDEYIPDLFLDPFILDVTDSYCYTVDARIKAKTTTNQSQYAYLCIFNNLQWTPIAIGKIENQVASFGKIAKNIVYLPVYYKQQSIFKAFNYPFILNTKGKIEYLIPDTRKIQKIRLYRKNPENFSSIALYFKRIKKCNVTASSSKTFKIADTVFKFDQTSLQNFISVNNLKDKAYKWYKINSPEQSNIAEIYCYDEEGNLVQAVVEERYSMLFDGDPLTYTVINEFNPLIFNFNRPVKLSKLVCLSRNDGNGIYPDNIYELFYFNLEGWQSLGKKKADYFYLEYDKVPTNALFWLRNLTSGMEERIFTYSDHQMIFW